MRINNLRMYLPIVWGLALSLVAPSVAGAQTATGDAITSDRVKVERTAEELRDHVRDAVRHDIDTTDTALVFPAFPGVPRQNGAICTSSPKLRRQPPRTGSRRTGRVSASRIRQAPSPRGVHGPFSGSEEIP